MTDGGGDGGGSPPARLWGVTALAGVAVVACVALGTWQFDRARTRDTPVTAGDPMAVAAVPLQGVVPSDGRVDPGTQPVAVTVEGSYDGEHQFLVPGRTQSGEAAVYVVTPLTVPTGDSVLVVRGWRPADPSGVEPAAPTPPGEDLTLTGWLVPSEPLDAGTVDALALPPGQLATITSARVAGLLPYPILDGYVGVVDEAPVAGSGLVRLEVPQIEATVKWSVQSLFYAFEWWFFALVVLWMGVQAWRIEQRRTGAGAVESGADQATAPPV